MDEMKYKKADKAVSQIIGSALLLLIALSILSTVYMYYLSYPLPNSAPRVVITGTVENRETIFTSLGTFEENFNIVLTHRGGEALPLDLEIMILQGNTTEYITAGDYLDSKSKDDGVWGIGEQIAYPAENISLKKIDVIVIDKVFDSVIFTATLQIERFVATRGTFNVQYDGSTLCMDYDFNEHGSGRVRFAYKNQSEESWSYTPWIPRSGMGFFHRRVDGLSCNTTYQYKSELKYDSTIVGGETKSFKTSNCP